MRAVSLQSNHFLDASIGKDEYMLLDYQLPFHNPFVPLVLATPELGMQEYRQD